MRQVAQNYKTGELVLLEVPSPRLRPGGVLVRTDFSLISAGTERMKVTESRLSLVGKARARPEQVAAVIQSAVQQGVGPTYRKVMNRLDQYSPLGYSLAGTIVAVPPDVDDLKVGDRVACAGDQFAFHAEVNWVPRNLCVAIPDDVSSDEAAFTTVGAIAMQGLRQSGAVLGETACVIGLGLVGQLLVQLLRAAGINVVGVDKSKERCLLAEAAGAAACGSTDEGLETVEATLQRLTQGHGADYVFLTASTSSQEPVKLAAKFARDRARIVEIGKTALDIPWTDFYRKELEVRFSRSYGPGRYDPSYEEDGQDYPIGYVRWTEGRNMVAFLQLLADRQLNLKSLIASVYDFDEAVAVYEKLHQGQEDGVGVLFRYPASGADDVSVLHPHDYGNLGHRDRPRAPRTPSGALKVGVIGAGNYATTMLLPHLAAMSNVELRAVATSTSLSVANVQRKFGFAKATTDYHQILDDDDIEIVIIATRHDTHGALVAEALRSGKAVYVEKPLGLSMEQLSDVELAVAESSNDRLMVGFNRRFAPSLTYLRKEWGSHSSPHTLQIVVNAGQLSGDSWYSMQDRHGSRFVGEGCHFIDLASWWFDGPPVRVFAVSTPDDASNLEATLHFENGSVAHISYATTGSGRYPKETLTVFGGGRTGRFSNFKSVRIWGGGLRPSSARWRTIDKGQAAQLEAFVGAVLRDESMPISLSSLLDTSKATLAVMTSAAERRVVPLAEPPLMDPQL